MAQEPVELPQLEEQLSGEEIQKSPWISGKSIGILLLFWLVSLVLILPTLIPHSISVEIGQPSPQDVIASRTISDRFETELRKRQAYDAIGPVLVIDQTIGLKVEEELNSFFDSVVQIHSRYADVSTRSGEIEKIVPKEWRLSDYVVPSLAQLSGQRLEEIRLVLIDILRPRYLYGISKDDFNSHRNLAQNNLVEKMGNDSSYPIAKDLLEQLIEVNVVVSEKETEVARQAAAAEVAPVMVLQGESILRTGDRVSERSYYLLEDLGLLDTSTNWDLVLAVAAGLFGLFLLLVMLLRLLAPGFLLEPSKIAVLGLLISFTLIFARAVLLINAQNTVLIPVPAATLIVAILFDLPLAIAFGVILSLMTSFLMISDIISLQLFLVGCLLAIFGSRSLRQRTDLLFIGLRIGLSQAMVIFMHGALRSDFTPEMLMSASMGLLSGLIAGFLALGLLPFLEGVFQLISALKLLELGNPNHPLLRKLMMEAPGSYQHSIMVANLSEIVCDEIKADSLLARVGATFHDVGKVKRPIYFVENQLQKGNPHDQLKPLVSASILFAHVKDGVELGREHKLPEQILQFIRSHHGTTEAAYFYRRAQNEAAEGETVNAEDFRYPGPKPPNREVAVVMLADACEAAARALNEPSEENIALAVQRICKERLNNGQLDDSDLTIRDLNRVIATLTKTLISVYHRRIQYPAEARVNPPATLAVATKPQAESQPEQSAAEVAVVTEAKEEPPKDD